MTELLPVARSYAWALVKIAVGAFLLGLAFGIMIGRPPIRPVPCPAVAQSDGGHAAFGEGTWGDPGISNLYIDHVWTEPGFAAPWMQSLPEEDGVCSTRLDGSVHVQGPCTHCCGPK